MNWRWGFFGWGFMVCVAASLCAHDGRADDPPQAAPMAADKIGSIPFAVPGDRTVEVAMGPLDDGRVIVYLHGVCGDPNAFESWIGAVVKHATLISLRGDEPCKKDASRFKWSWNSKKQVKRIDAAITAVDELRKSMADSVEVTPLDREHVTLIGYSQGAHRAEVLAHLYPGKFERVALIAMAAQPDAGRLHRVKRVLLMAGGWDARTHIYDGYQSIRRTKKDAVRYLELPKARHGEYGPKAKETMADALAWLFAPLPSAGHPDPGEE